VAGQDELDLGVAQRLHYREVFLAGNAKDAFDALVLQRRDQQIRAFAHASLLAARSRLLQGKDGASRADFIGCDGGELNSSWLDLIRGPSAHGLSPVGIHVFLF
jgi:hypothetical protein